MWKEAVSCYHVRAVVWTTTTTTEVAQTAAVTTTTVVAQTAAVTTTTEVIPTTAVTTITATSKNNFF